MIKTERKGETVINNQGMEMTIINYINNSDIDIQFSDGTIVRHVQYYAFTKGGIRNHNIPSYLNKGYLGYGKYKARINKIKTEEYIKWGSMLTRCYSEKLQERRNYIDCKVCEEWLNFQNFAKWYNENKYYIPDNEKLELDKDIKIKGNKIYSPETCILIPKRINSIILNRHNDRGNLCVGVSYNKKLKKYTANCNRSEKENAYIGLYNTEIEAFNAYKQEKENEIYRVLQIYKEYIPEDTYQAVLNYKIEITD
jgi:hypothetical protein